MHESACFSCKSRRNVDFGRFGLKATHHQKEVRFERALVHLSEGANEAQGVEGRAGRATKCTARARGASCRSAEQMDFDLRRTMAR
eukprot:3578505-Pleurochrysis_carterae.AAC.1